MLDAVLAIQAVVSACPRGADIVQLGNFGSIRTFAECASDEFKECHLPGLLAGEHLLALGITEPDAGSTVTDLRSSCRGEGDGLVINDAKVFSSHSADAQVFLVYVRFGPGVGVGGIGSVILEKTPGFEIGEPTTFAPKFAQALGIAHSDIQDRLDGFLARKR